MKVKVPILLLALLGTTLAATPAAAAATSASSAGSGPATSAAEVVVARYSFDRGAVNGAVADISGRGLPLRIRSADGGIASFITHGAGRAIKLPARCAKGATRCARVILEGGDDADLDPGTRAFRWGASVAATAAQTGTGANIMQKGVSTTASQWKLQVGGRKGKASCVLIGRGSKQPYIAKSSISVTSGAWHTLACSRTATALTVFVNGVARGSVAIPATLSISNDLPLRVGGRNLSTTSDQFGGSIDDVWASII